jgi:predicted transcriptional regulator
MPKKSDINLSRRERQIMDIIYRKGRASAAEVMEGLPDPPSYSAVRALLRVLEDKGHLKHTKAGARYIYIPTQPRHKEKAVAALLNVSDTKLSPEELDQLSRLIDEAREEGR